MAGMDSVMRARANLDNLAELHTEIQGGLESARRGAASVGERASALKVQLAPRLRAGPSAGRVTPAPAQEATPAYGGGFGGGGGVSPLLGSLPQPYSDSRIAAVEEELRELRERFRHAADIAAASLATPGRGGSPPRVFRLPPDRQYL